MGHFWGINCIFRMCTPSDTLHQNMCALGYVVMMLQGEMMSHGTLVTSCHDVVMTL